MGKLFAIITFRDTGPIKTWSDMRGANVHNARTKPIEHAVPGAPAPEHLVGSRDLVADVKGKLRRAGIDPDKIRKNGVIAYEAIMTASPGFFEEGGAVEQKARLGNWARAQVKFAMDRWGAHRVASMVLHLDEKTPHIHLVVLPLEVKSDRRRRDSSVVRWSLVGRTISGPGQFDKLQDDYADAMSPFGLSRGEAGSGRKHEPMGQFMARTEREKVEAARARAAAIEQQQALDASMLELSARRAASAKWELELEVERRAAQKERRRLEAERQALAVERAEIDGQRSSLQVERALMASARAQHEQDLAVVRSAMVRAKAFLERMSRVSAGDAHPVLQQAMVAAHALRSHGPDLAALAAAQRDSGGRG